MYSGRPFAAGITTSMGECRDLWIAVTAQTDTRRAVAAAAGGSTGVWAQSRQLVAVGSMCQMLLVAEQHIKDSLLSRALLWFAGFCSRTCTDHPSDYDCCFNVIHSCRCRSKGKQRY